MNKATRAAGAVVLGTAVAAVLASPAAAVQDRGDCQWGKVCTWTGPDFSGGITQSYPDGQCHSGNFFSLVNRTQAVVRMFADDNCQSYRDSVYPDQDRSFAPGAGWRALS